VISTNLLIPTGIPENLCIRKMGKLAMPTSATAARLADAEWWFQIPSRPCTPQRGCGGALPYKLSPMP
jgi:hypothetical protein